MRELLDRMERMSELLASREPGLARTLQFLSQQGQDPDRRAQPAFRHEVAYALQDMEKSPLGRIDINADLRAEMTRLAGTAPGLENERMQALMRSTASIDDRGLVREIRHMGNSVGRQVDQHLPETLSHIDVMENQVRLAGRPAEPAPSAAAERTERPGEGRAASEQSADRGTRQDGRRFAGATRDDAPASNPGPAQHMGQPRAGGQQQVYGRSVLDSILSGMRPGEQRTGAPWDPPPTPMAERLSAFEKKMMEGRDEQSFERAMKSGRAALDAMQAFSNREGATVMSRIHEAAQSTPGGMATVLSEMRDGGRFADLRKQFSNALETDLGLASAYDKAATALGRYGQDRAGVQDIIGRRPDASAITARFEQMDAEIGKVASATPGRTDGKSMMDELTQKAAELLHRAVDAVKSAFSGSPAADAASRPSPSPSMSG
ncbi:MAG: hypothetical protein J0H14_07105 [Alphaproteobacteria bacterium]|nr:hypothetical protein [Alphaproteobacteria bacterium]